MSVFRSLEGYHDWYLYGIEVDDVSHDVVLSVKLDSVKKKVCFRGVELLQADRFTIGNIIFSIDVYKGEAALDRFSAELSSGGIDRTSIAVPSMEKLEHMVKQEGLVFVELSTSYGCEASLMCRSIVEYGG